jgi:hypothetical protein
LLLFVDVLGVLNSYLSFYIAGAVSRSGYHIFFRDVIGIAADRLRDYWDFGLRLSSGNLKTVKNTTFRELDLFPSSGEGMGTPILFSPSTRVNPCTTYVKVKVNVASLPTATQSVSLGVEPLLGLMTRF